MQLSYLDVRNRSLLFTLGLGLASLLLSCGLYKPLASPSTDLEYIQEGQYCLHTQNYSCALEAYGKISDSDLKNEKICLAQLTRAGLTLSAMITTIASESASSTMLGSLAKAIIPWTADKETASTAAITECNKLSTLSDTSKSSMLRIFAYLTDCAVRIAKTDLWVAVSESAASCNSTTPGNATGLLNDQDIVHDQSSALSSTNAGMCKYDVTQCLTDLSAAVSLETGLSPALSRIANNLDVLQFTPNPATATVTARVQLISTL